MKDKHKALLGAIVISLLAVIICFLILGGFAIVTGTISSLTPTRFFTPMLVCWIVLSIILYDLFGQIDDK